MTRNPRIRSQLLVGLIAIVLVMGLAAGITMWQERVGERAFAGHKLIASIERLLLECRRQEKNFFLRVDATSVHQFGAELANLQAEINTLRTALTESGLTESMHLLTEAQSQYDQAFQNAVHGWANADPDAQARLEAETVASARKCHALIQDIASRFAVAHSAAATTTLTVSFLSLGVGLVLSLATAWALTRTIAGPLEELRSLAARATSGDIQDLDVAFADLEIERFRSRECRDLALALRKMVTGIRLLVPSERGLMDHYHMAIVVLVHRAVGSAAWSVIERARAAAGFASFSEVGPSNVGRFLGALDAEVQPLASETGARLLASAIGALR